MARRGDKPKQGPVTNAGEIEVVGMPAIDEKAVEAIENDFNDLFADVQNDLSHADGDDQSR